MILHRIEYLQKTDSHHNPRCCLPKDLSIIVKMHEKGGTKLEIINEKIE